MMAIAEKWTWDLYPLRPDAVDPFPVDDPRLRPGSVYTQTLIRLYGPAAEHKRYVVPEETLDYFRSTLPDFDPRHPPWLLVKAALIRAGHRPMDLERTEVPILLALLGEAEAAEKEAGRQAASVAEHEKSNSSRKPEGREVKRARWLGLASILVKDHPDWSDAAVAREADVAPSTLSRDPVYQAVAVMARCPRTPPRRGYVTTDSDTGHLDVEAVDDASDPANMNWDD
jgi:hypothetical protein